MNRQHAPASNLASVGFWVLRFGLVPPSHCEPPPIIPARTPGGSGQLLGGDVQAQRDQYGPGRPV
jgi:hypothetical protein